MGGQACGMLSRVSFLLFPHPWNVGGVWLGGTQVQRCTEKYGFGMLLGPEEIPVGWGFLGGCSWPGLSNALCCWWVWWWLWWVGVWWCVECCIVDASILLCLVLWFDFCCVVEVL